MYKLPSLKGSAFLTYSPARTVEGNNVAFEYKDSVYEDIRNYISLKGLTTPSDLNLKENITYSAFDSEKLLSLAIKDFNYKADKSKTRYTGLIAQELKSELPALVTGTEGHYSIDYPKMVPYLLKILQDQQKEIVALKSRSALPNKQAAGTDIMDLINRVQQRLQRQQEEIQSIQASIKINK